MSVYYSVNGFVAVEPPETRSMKTEVVKGFRTPSQDTYLAPLKVVFLSEKYLPGMIIYVPGANMKQEWAKEEFVVDGKKVIFVPEALVKIVEQPADLDVTTRT